MLINIIEKNTKDHTNQNLFKSALRDPLYKIFDPNFIMMNSDDSIKLSNLSGIINNREILAKISTLIKIITHVKGVSDENNYDERYLYFFSRFIPIYTKWEMKNGSIETANQINSFDKITKQLEIRYYPGDNTFDKYWFKLSIESDINSTIINSLIALCNEYNPNRQHN